MRRQAIVVSVAISMLSIGAAGNEPSPTQRAWLSPEETFVVRPNLAVATPGAIREGGVAEKPSRVAFGPSRSPLSARHIARIKSRIHRSPNLPQGTILDLERRDAARGAPGVTQRFTGLTQETALNRTPSFRWVFFAPDTAIAASPTHILQSVNAALLLIDRGTGARIVETQNDHHGQTVNDNGDQFIVVTKAHFDTDTERFFVTGRQFNSDTKASWLHLSVSRTSAPGNLSRVAAGGGRASGDWCTYQFTGKQEGPSGAMSPQLGMGSSWAAISVNNWDFDGGFRQAFIYAFDKARIAANAGGCRNLEVSKFAVPDDNSGESPRTVQPARHLDDSAGTATHFLSTQCCDEATSDQYLLWTLDGDAREGGRAPALSFEHLTGDEYSIPPNAQQKDKTQPLITTGVDYVLAAVVSGGELIASHSTGCKFGTAAASCARIVEVSLAGAGGRAATIIKQSTLGLGKNKYVFMPAVSRNARGDIATVFQIAGKQLHLGIGFTGRRAGKNLFEKAAIYEKGDRGISCVGRDGDNRNQVGFYAGIAVDPGDGTSFILSAEDANKKVDTFDDECEWGTRIGEVAY